MSSTSSELVSNRKALFHFELLETYEAGIVLRGTEIKSLRDHGGALQDSWVKVEKGELWLVGCHISPYRFGTLYNHPERRERKLLMHQQEIKKLKIAIQEKGLTLFPLSIYLKGGRAKVKLALGRGKKVADKRDAIQSREEKRRIDQALKSRNQ